MKKLKMILRIGWNIVLTTSVKAAVLMFILGACLADNVTPAPLIMMVTSGAWLALMGYANGWFVPNGHKKGARR